MVHNLKIKDYLVNISLKTGEILLDLQNKPLDPLLKGNNTPVTIADTRAHDFITQNLKKDFPLFPVKSEEGEGEISLYSGLDFFLIDPLDGTKGYIRGSKNYAVCLAFMQGGKPTVGVIYAPARRRLFWAVKGEGAFEVDVSGMEKQLLNHENTQPPFKGIVGSSSGYVPHYDWHIMPFQRVSSALKFGLLAAGEVDFYPRLGETGEWDTAAGQILLEESGGGIVDWHSLQTLTYLKADFLNKGFIAFRAREIMNYWNK